MLSDCSASSLAWSLLNYTLLLAGFYISYKIYHAVKRHRECSRLAASWGCAPSKTIRSKDPFLALDMLREVYREIKAHTVLEYNKQLFAKLQTYTYGVVVRWEPAVITTLEPENIKCILATKFKDFYIDDNRKKVLKPMIGEGIFVSDGQTWQHSRDLLKPQFARAQFDGPELFEKHADNLMKAIPRNGEVFDLQPLFGYVSLDVATQFLFGQSAGTLDPKANGDEKSQKSIERFYTSFDYLVRSINAEDSRFGMLGIFLPDWNFKKHVKIMHSYVDELISDAIAREEKSSSDSDADEKPHRYTFLSELVKATDDRIKLRHELLNILLAGKDTTDSLLSNIFFTLSQRPDILKKLQDEIDASDLPETPNFSQLKSLPYLRALINESERLYPNVPENSRQAIVDTMLPLGGGPDGKQPVLVSKGTMVHWSLYGMHRRKDIYGEDAEEFRPERWLDEDVSDENSEHTEGEVKGKKKGLRVGWEYLPFNGGPRVCLGQQFALMEVSYVVVKIVREFEIEAEEIRPWREKLGVVATIDGGVRVKVKPRT